VREREQNMILENTRFGTIEVEDDRIITFAKGIPGFEHLTRYVLIVEKEGVLEYLQSVEEPRLSFILVDPFLYCRDYEFELSDQTVEDLEIRSEEDLIIRCILSIRDEVKNATMNLVAPIVINAARKLGKQVILTKTAYGTRHPLFPDQVGAR